MPQQPQAPQQVPATPYPSPNATIARPAAAPYAQQPPYAPGYDQVAMQGIAPAPKKSNAAPIIAGVIAAIAVVGIIVAAFLTNGFGLVGGGGFGPFGNSDEAIIKRQISSFVETIKNPSDKDMELLGATSDDLDELRSYGIDPAELMRVLFRYLSCKVNNVSVDGDTAVASVTVSNVDFGKVYASIEAKAMDPNALAELMSYNMNGDNAALGKWVFKAISDCIDENKGNLTSVDIDLNFERRDGTWTIAELDTDELMSMLFGDMNIDSIL